MDPIPVTPIGVVVCDERNPARWDWNDIPAEIRLDPPHEGALLGLADYSHVLVIGWLHLVPEGLRERTQAYPAGNSRLPLQGSLALRGGARPNPLSVTVCRLRRVAGVSLFVEGLDLVDGTPVLDVKPYIAHYDSVPEATLPAWAQG